MAVALLSSTPLYSNALNDLGLNHTLRERPIELLDVNIYVSNSPVNIVDYLRNSEFIDQQVKGNIGSIVRQEERYMKSRTFYAAWADRPTPTGAARPEGYFQVFTNLEKHVKLVDGRFPVPIVSTGQVFEALIGSETAEIFGVEVGDQLIFLNYWGSPPEITIRLSGIIDPIDPTEEYWFMMANLFTASEDEGMVAPLFIPEETFFGGFGHTWRENATYNWFYYVDLTRINTQNAGRLENAVNRMERQISAQLPGSGQFTLMHEIISSYQRQLLFTQIPLFLIVFQIVAIVLYYVVTVASMVIERQSGEIALLRSRGASTGQIVGVFFMEGLLISAIGGAVGPFLGALIFSLLGKTAPFIPLTEGGFLPIRFSSSVFLLAAVTALLCLIAFLVPAVQAARRSVVHQRQHAARPQRAPFWQRFYLDLVLLVVGGVLYWEMRQRGALLAQDIFGGLSVDPLLLVTPILLMFAVAIVFLRLFPIILGLAARLGRYVTNASTVLGLWYMARNPVHYGRLILLLMMAAAVGMFSASFLGTLDRSYSERAMYSAGSDVRLEGLYDWRTGKDALVERYSSIPGVEDLSAVYRGSATLGTLFTQLEFTLIALDPESFEQVAWYRDDFSEKPFPELMSLLADDQPDKQGLALPEGTESIGIWVRPVQPDSEVNVFVFARIEDGLGYYIDCELGSPASGDWEYLEASLKREGTRRLPTSPLSLRCLYVRVSQSGSAFQLAQPGIYFDDLQVRGSFSTDPVVVEDFEDVAGWTAIVDQSSSRTSMGKFKGGGNFTTNRAIVHNGASSGEFNWGTRRASGYKGLYPNLNIRPLVVVASPSLLSMTGVSVGDIVDIRVPGQYISVEFRDVVDYFPTLDPENTRFAIVNLDRISSVRNLLLGTPKHFYPNEIWLTVTDDGEQRQAALDTLNTVGYRAETLYDKEAMIAESKADPLVAAGWGGILLIAFLGVILVSGLGFVVYAYLSARGRQLEFAILRTLGFSLRQIIWLVSFEQLLVIGAGMIIGTVLGLRLSAVMMPFLQLTEMGERVLPPFIPVVDWGTIGIAYIILSVAFVITISLVVLFFSKVALHRALRVADE